MLLHMRIATAAASWRWCRPIGWRDVLAKAHPDLEISVEAMATKATRFSIVALAKIWRQGPVSQGTGGRCCSIRGLDMLSTSSGPATNLLKVDPWPESEREDPADALLSTPSIRTRDPWPHCRKAVWWQQLPARLAKSSTLSPSWSKDVRWQCHHRLENSIAGPVRLPDPGGGGAWDPRFDGAIH